MVSDEILLNVIHNLNFKHEIHVVVQRNNNTLKFNLIPTLNWEYPPNSQPSLIGYYLLF